LKGDGEETVALEGCWDQRSSINNQGRQRFKETEKHRHA
jgi:hypothetical protein